jgi:hypothetical protein
MEVDATGRLIFTGYCPVPPNKRATYPYNSHVFSKLYVDECLAFNASGTPHWLRDGEKGTVPAAYVFQTGLLVNDHLNADEFWQVEFHLRVSDWSERSQLLPGARNASLLESATIKLGLSVSGLHFQISPS